MKRSWNRVGKWETRVFEDLKAFCTAEDDFRYIRRAIAALVAAKPLTGQEDSTGAGGSASDLPAAGMTMASGGKGGRSNVDAQPTSCVPFIGEDSLFRFHDNWTNQMSLSANRRLPIPAAPLQPSPGPDRPIRTGRSSPYRPRYRKLQITCSSRSLLRPPSASSFHANRAPHQRAETAADC